MRNSFRHNRHTIRLKGFDYSSYDVYYVTIVAQDRQCLFGEIVNQTIVLNRAGQMVEKWIKELPKKFPGISLDQSVIMPNHVHFNFFHIGADLCASEIEHQEYNAPELSDIVQWFKTMTTNDYIHGVKNMLYPPFNKRVWQRNYYEKIIRTETELKEIQRYIMNNPAQWEQDESNPRFGPYLNEIISN